MQTSPAIGSFSATPTISFGGSPQNGGNRFALSFMPAMRILAGEEITVSLPFFTAPLSPLVHGATASAFGNVSRWDASRRALVFKVAQGKTITRDHTVSVFVVGLSAVVGGVSDRELEEATVTIETNAVEGPVPATLVSKVCKHDTLSFTKCCVGSVGCLF